MARKKRGLQEINAGSMADIAFLLDKKKINNLVVQIANIKKKNGRIFFLGVGGSAGNASHAVNDFRKLCNIDAISPQAYGMMKGEEVLQQALELIN